MSRDATDYPTWATVISLNRFLGPVDDSVTTDSTVTKSQSHPGARAECTVASVGTVLQQTQSQILSKRDLHDRNLS